MSDSATVEPYVDTPTHVLTASNGVQYAYRITGRSEATPLVMLQHFRGNLDNWDPALTDALADEREVVLVDYAGVGSSTGEPSSTIAESARQLIAFIAAVGLARVELLGFSIGGFVAQEIALVRPALARRLVLAATGPKAAPGMHGWREDITAAAPDAQYPDAAHGFLFQYPAKVAADVNAFLASEGSVES